jgi:hypothetical protein
VNLVLALALTVHILPEKEQLVYETDDKGKIGHITVVSYLDSAGYHVTYTSDRTINCVLDSIDLSTRFVEKTIGDRLELSASQHNDFEVYFRGTKYRYHEKDPVYDRHTLDFALRGFPYHSGYKKTFRLHIPEFMIVNGELDVVSSETVDTPLGNITCWKLTMKPRVFFINWQFYFWIEQAYPHRFVRYEDSSGENRILLVEYVRLSGI